MELREQYGFDSEYTVILKGVKTQVELEEVQQAFSLLDNVVKIQHIDHSPDTILCQFSESITSMLLDCEHSIEDTCWEVIQIDEYSLTKSEESPKKAVVPLAQALGNMTVSFREQVNEMALAYNISPTTLHQVALSQVCGREDSDHGSTTSTPAAGFKSQHLVTPSPAVSCEVKHPTTSTHENLVINPLPTDVQKVIVEHIVRQGCTAAAREL